ncbi:MAG: hypothetical protein WDM96_04045 [Lacunisphaera sp.]
MLSRLKAGNTIVYTGDAPAGWRRVDSPAPSKPTSTTRILPRASR